MIKDATRSFDHRSSDRGAPHSGVEGHGPPRPIRPPPSAHSGAFLAATTLAVITVVRPPPYHADNRPRDRSFALRMAGVGTVALNLPLTNEGQWLNW